MVKRKSKKQKRKERNRLFGGLFLILIILFLIFKTPILAFLSSIQIPQTIINDTETEEITPCYDSDEGLSYYMAGNVLKDGTRYYDKCEDNVMLTEYICDGNEVKSQLFACPLEYSCVQTRSGGLCERLPTHNDGDLLESSGGSGSSTDSTNTFEVDMSNIGSGNCELGGTLDTSWDYGNQECAGLQAMEGVKWSFYDSSGLIYTRTETSPTNIGFDLGCGLYYDGVTPFKLKMEKLYGFEGCEIDYQYEIRIVTCNCQ